MDIPVDTESLIRNKNTIPQKVMDARGTAEKSAARICLEGNETAGSQRVADR